MVACGVIQACSGTLEGEPGVPPQSSDNLIDSGIR